MNRWSIPAIRIALGIIFIWFGILKPLGLSPAEQLVLRTTSWMPFAEPHFWLAVIGYWEVAIGISFLMPKLTRVAIALLFLQMGGTFLPLIMLPEIAFQPSYFPFAPTIEGQYIIKNLLILAAALVVGGTVYRSDRTK